MSATNRGQDRRKDDAYYTPAWVTRLLMEHVIDLNVFTEGSCLEPSAGDGAIVSEVSAYCVAAGYRTPPLWFLRELDPEKEAAISHWGEVRIGDWLAMDEPYGFDNCIMNPPYNQAQQFVEKAVDLCADVYALLRLNYLGSVKRNAFLRKSTPDVYVIPNRPSFTGKGTDATEYAWFHWGSNSLGGSLTVLPTLPKADRTK